MQEEKVIMLAGRMFRVCGDPDDPYFSNLDGVAAALAPLEAWVRRNIRPDAVIFDAGGNIGLTALLFCALVPEGQVHVFEASPANTAYLKRNVSDNGLSNCTVNMVALGDRPGSVFMQGSGSSSHVVHDGGSDDAVGGGDVSMITLDGYAEDRGIVAVDLVKIDVEGFEPAVLAGAGRLMEHCRPTVFMELNTWCLNFIHGFSASDFAERLWDAFEVTSIDQDGIESPAGGGSAFRFLHDNVVHHGTIEDVVLRLRAGKRVPAKGLVAPPLPDPDVIAQLRRVQAELRAELRAIRQSSSWRITAPLRGLAAAVRSMTGPRQ